MFRAVLLVFLCLGVRDAARAGTGDRLMVCGMGEVFEIDPADQGRKRWIWRAADRAELPADLKRAFATTDECKPVESGTKLLISASSGGCALVHYPSGFVAWHARVSNAHSMELLPDNRVVVAASVSPQGNKLAVFDLAVSGVPVFETPLPSAHGVVWDTARQRLWAPGLDELRCYRLENWTRLPSLVLERSHPLPGHDGHDLMAVPGSDDLVLSTESGVWLFDRTTSLFRPHPSLGREAEVKCLSPHPAGKRWLWVAADHGQWWSRHLRLDLPGQTLTLPGERIYKARWMPVTP